MDRNQPQVCRICLRSGPEQLYSLMQKKLIQAYYYVTGLELKNKENVPMHMCAECANQLQGFIHFRSRTVQAHLMLVEVAKKHKHISPETIKATLGREHFYFTKLEVKHNKPGHYDRVLEHAEIYEPYEEINEEPEEEEREAEEQEAEEQENVVVNEDDDKTPNDVSSESDTTPADVPSESDTTPAVVPSASDTIPVVVPSESDTTPAVVPSESDTTPAVVPSESDTTPVVVPSESDTTPVVVPSESDTTPNDVSSESDTTTAIVLSESDTTPADVSSEIDTTPADVSSEIDTKPAVFLSESDTTPAVVPSESDTIPADVSSEIDTTPADLSTEIDKNPDVFLSESDTTPAIVLSESETTPAILSIGDVEGDGIIASEEVNIGKRNNKTKASNNSTQGTVAESDTTAKPSSSSIVNSVVSANENQTNAQDEGTYQFSQNDNSNIDLSRHMGPKLTTSTETVKDEGNDNLEEHTETPTAIYVCGICDKGFCRVSVLQTHVKTHTVNTDKPHACQKTFNEKTLLKKPSKTPWLDTNFDECNQPSTSNIQKIHACETCGETSNTEALLRAHVKTHAMESTCLECPKTFSNKYALTKHAKTHKTKNFPCKGCSKEFAIMGELRKHQKSHRKAE